MGRGRGMGADCIVPWKQFLCETSPTEHSTNSLQPGEPPLWPVTHPRSTFLVDVTPAPDPEKRVPRSHVGDIYRKSCSCPPKQNVKVECWKTIPKRGEGPIRGWVRFGSKSSTNNMRHDPKGSPGHLKPSHRNTQTEADCGRSQHLENSRVPKKMSV